jgi:hypothetical protein
LTGERWGYDQYGILRYFPAQIASFTTDQIPIIDTQDIAALSSGQVSSLTTMQVMALASAQIEALQYDRSYGWSMRSELPFSSAQIQALTPDHIAALTTYQITTLTPYQVAAFRTDQIQSLETRDVSALPSSAVAGLSSQQIGALTTDQVVALTTAQFSALTGHSRYAPLSTLGITLQADSTYQQMNSFQIGGLPDAEKKLIFDTYLAKFYISNSGKKYALFGTDLGSGIFNNRVFLTHNKLDGLFNEGNDTYATNITIGTDDARSVVLGNTQYVLPTISELRVLNAEGAWAKAGWTWGSYWSADLMQNGNHGALDQPHDAFTSDFFGEDYPIMALVEIIDLSLTEKVAQLPAFSTSQIAVFETADLKALISSQISALSSVQFGSLTTSQLAAIETQDFVGITSAQLNALTSTSINSLGQAQFNGSLTSSQIEALLSNSISGLTSSQIPALAGITPVVLDLDGNGIQTVNTHQGVTFDIDNDGRLERTAWVGRGDGLLVRDLNGDSRINDGGELFGSGTVLADGTKAADGYAAMRALDSNLDGLLDSKDAAFGELAVWRDKDGDGIADAGEIVSLSGLGINSLSLEATASTEVNNGNLIGLLGSYTKLDGTIHTMGDVWFQTDSSGARVFDLAAVANAAGSSNINLTNTTAETLRVAMSDVLEVGEADILTGISTVRLTGDVADTVQLTGEGGWSLAGTTTDGSENYLVYVNQNAQLLINDKINVVIG